MSRGEFDGLDPALRECGAEVAMVLGSGLGAFADELETIVRLPYAQLPGIPVSGVPGHAGELMVARIGGRPLLIAKGRVHLYEGHSARDVTAMIRLFASIGVRHLVLTNAAGLIRADFAPGEWMMLSDHLNLTGTSPLEGAPNFSDMTEVYCADMRGVFREAAARLSIPLREGVYASLRGPQYETPAEIRMLRVMGADAVGMSTVPEAIQSRALGIRTCAFSCLTNWGAGLGEGELGHSEVTEMGRHAAGKFLSLLRESIPALPAQEG